MISSCFPDFNRWLMTPLLDQKLQYILKQEHHLYRYAIRTKNARNFAYVNCFPVLTSRNTWVSRATSPRIRWFSDSAQRVSHRAFGSRVTTILTATPICQSTLSCPSLAPALAHPAPQH